MLEKKNSVSTPNEVRLIGAKGKDIPFQEASSKKGAYRV